MAEKKQSQCPQLPLLEFPILPWVTGQAVAVDSTAKHLSLVATAPPNSFVTTLVIIVAARRRKPMDGLHEKADWDESPRLSKTAVS